MPTLSTVKGIKVYINWIAGHDFPSRQLKIILGWAACHQQELMDNWTLIAAKEPHYEIPPTL